VENITPDIAQQLNLPMGTKGVVVDNVDANSAAAEKLQRGDVVIEVNRKSVSNLTDYRNALSGAGDKAVLLLVIPQGQPTATQYVLIEPNS
jgi:serine protease Do